MINQKNWKLRIDKHKNRRPKSWKLIEDFKCLDIELNSLHKQTLLIDSIGGLVYRFINSTEDVWLEYRSKIITSLINYKGKIVIVLEEVGSGLSPSNQIGNIFRDRIGEFSQELEDISSKSYLIIHGRPLNLKRLYDK